MGAVIMMLIGANCHFMMNRYGSIGGTYSYTKHVFGHDHAFLSAWFLSLTYISITWANVTALALIARTLFGSLFQFGVYYSIAGYSIYFGEIIFEIGILVFVMLLCIYAKKITLCIQIIFAFILLFGIVYCFVACTKNPLIKIFSIAALSPWAFVGFESVSHSAREFRFSTKKSFLIMALAVVAGFAAYTLLTFIAVPSYSLVSMPVSDSFFPSYFHSFFLFRISGQSVRLRLSPILFLHSGA